MLGITETKLCKTFGVSSLEDLVERLTAEAEGIKAKCLAVFKKTHPWYRDEVIPLSEDTVVDNSLMS